jgi:hypothetical protein
LRDFYNRAPSCATLQSFVPSFTTCSVLPLDYTLVLSFVIPSTVRPFSTVHDMWAPCKTQLIPLCNLKKNYSTRKRPAPCIPHCHRRLCILCRRSRRRPLLLKLPVPSPLPPDQHLTHTVWSGITDSWHHLTSRVNGSMHQVPTGPSVVLVLHPLA